MAEDPETFIREVTEQVRTLHIQFSGAMWQSATTGTEQAARREKDTKAELMRFWADTQLYETAKNLNETSTTDDPLQRRTLKRIYLSSAKAQQDEATIEAITNLETETQRSFYNFRALVDGKPISDNEVENILRTSRDSAAVRKVWEASKRIGEEVADHVRELAHLRNKSAQAQGFRDHFQRSLVLNEIEEAHLAALFTELEKASQKPFLLLKKEIDRIRAEHFSIDAADLRPWHYGDRFFQRAPELSKVPLDPYFADRDPVELALETYDGMDIDVRGILDRSDLYPREGKDQHAFCIDIDREGDVRTLNNLEPSHRWTSILLHELGHAVYDEHIDPKLPWILRTPPHPLSTEAIALLMQTQTYDHTWLSSVLGIKDDEAARLSSAAVEQQRAQRLVFTRWALVMTDFERALYADPDRELNTLWWDLVEKYQALQRPENRSAPDWAAKYHIALTPVYYHSYEIGHLVTSQLQAFITGQMGARLGQPEVGQWLIENYFRPGASQDWASHVESVTGEALNPKYFVDSIQ
jgi:peptidyl-dipeptidase A